MVRQNVYLTLHFKDSTKPFLFRTLLELGASPNYKDCKGLTPLYMCVMHAADVVLCEMLLHDHSIVGAQDLQGWQEVHQVGWVFHFFFYSTSSACD